jgi:hypothetical protein
MSEYEFTIALRVRHPTVEPEQITQALGLDPQHTWRAGEARRGPAGEPLEGTYRESYWMAHLMAEPQYVSEPLSVERAMLQAIAKLRRSFQYLAELSAEGGVAELQVSIFAREAFKLELLAESLALLGRLGLDVVLDVQPHPSPATETAMAN